MKNCFSLIFLFVSIISFAQTSLVTEGQTFTNSSGDTWNGVNIPRSSTTELIFKNNSITSVNRVGYLLQAGDEGSHANNNNLDGAIILGNKLTWNGTDMTSITHGLFTGHNSDVIIKYNYLNHVPMGIIRKSTTNMSNTAGGVAYNIVKGGAVAVVVKGMSNVNIYNNTLYSDRTTSQTWRPLVHVYTNTDSDGYSVAHGTKIFNNIFYTKFQTLSIKIDDNESLTGLECDYNVYWCENGSPRFSVNGSTITFEQWQAMGYDQHSVVVNPKFRDLVHFVPGERLNYGRDLGPEWVAGIGINASWGKTDPRVTSQNGVWQVGAVVYSQSDTTFASDEVFFIYPNPAREFISVSNLYTITEPAQLKIYDVEGRLHNEITVGPGASDNIPLNLGAGLYIVHLIVGSTSRHVQRLVIIE